ncbi:hypothetical protein IX326_001589 [Porphyromonas levii]|nr:hypothetical protein [Porphyromonas levii]
MVEIVFVSDNKRAAAYDEGKFVGESTFQHHRTSGLSTTRW